MLFISMALLILGACSGKKSREKLQEEVIATWAENDKPKAAKYYDIIDGKKVKVEEVFFHPNGAVSREESYNKEGKAHGEWKLYYPNGAKRATFYFKEGVREGKYTTYFENGKVNITGEYKNDKQTGVWKTFDEKGKLKKEENFN